MGEYTDTYRGNYFRHHKGEQFQIIEPTATDDDTGIVYVVYGSTFTGEVKVMRIEDFYGTVVRPDATTVLRFTREI
jgi:hypothetical protein